MTDTLQDVISKTRVYSDWNSTKGLRTDILPWRLWDKAKKLHWDPADLDFSQDRKDWDAMSLEHKLMLAGLANGFMVGEEGVTLDIMPMVFAMADEGRAEETMFLTNFCYEEAKHVDFFNRWYQAIGADPLEMRELARKNQAERGVELGDADQADGLFEKILPNTMRRLLVDRSPQAFLEASVTYNQFIEGCLAIAGYKMWGAMFDMLGVMPGLRAGLTHVQADERRHIAYGTYLCRRIIARDHSLAEVAIDKMYDLRDMYIGTFAGSGGGAPRNGSNGNGKRERLSAEQLIEQAQQRAAELRAASGQGNGGGGGYGGDGDGEFQIFGQVMLKQVDRRIEILRNATKLDPDAAERGGGAEQLEAAV